MAGVLKGDKKPSITINELAAITINIKGLFWVDIYKTTNRSVHHSIRSKVMNYVVVVLIANGISLPAPVVPIKNFESTPVNSKVEITENEIIKP